MYRVHYYKYKPVLTAERKYRLELPIGVHSRVFRTMTTGMRWWHGEVLEASQGRARALTGKGEVECPAVGNLKVGHPCYIMEHINVDGYLELWITENNIFQGNELSGPGGH
jgi:hypothetical protein